MQRIDNIDKWTPLVEGEMVTLEKAKARTIKIHVNAPQETRLFVSIADQKPQFLAVVKGLDTVTFGAAGKVEFLADAEIYFQTSENEAVHSVGDGEKFTKIMERQPRNPEFERAQAMMMRNMESRFAKQQREYDAMMQRREADFRKSLEAEREAVEKQRASDAADVKKASGKAGKGADADTSGPADKKPDDKKSEDV